MRRLSRLWLFPWLGALALASAAGAKTVYVGNDGVDGPACGTKAAPCRSITQGIAGAAAGDTIQVGPGRYGDLDGDGTLAEPGEEAGAIGAVDVDKPVRVLSRDGAAATVIEADGLGAGDPIVRLSADGSIFGKRNGGFTILAGGAIGIRAAAAGVTIAGNTVLLGTDGIEVNGADAVVSDNRAIRNTTGLSLFGPACAASRNAVIGNTTAGIHAEGIGCVLDANVAVANGFGITTDSSDLVIRRSTIAGNGSAGAGLVGSNLRVESSSFFGNSAQDASNCAIFSESALDATGNYWGSPLGPGPDPADLVCSDGIGFDPFAKKGTAPKLKPIR